VLAGADRRSMNVEGSFQHLLTDLAAFVITAIAGVVILATGQTRADGAAAIVIAVIMLRASYVLLRDSGRVLLEAAPEGMDIEEIGRALAGHHNVTNVHDLHVWEIGTGFPALSAHVLVAQGDDCHAVRRELEEMLDARFGIEHTTLQVEHEKAGRLLRIGRS
jgi:cobalt-zinc-cadmium efflux system protein